MRDVARLAGVGIKTVSRVVNGEPNVSPTTTEKVRAAAAQLSYEPDLHAGNLRRSGGRTQTLGLLVSSVANPFAGQVHRAIERVATAHGYAVLAASLEDDPAAELRAVSALARRRVDGFIVTPVRDDQSYLQVHADRGSPVVSVDREPTGVETDSVVTSNHDGARGGVRHLVDHGHRRIAFLGDLERIQTARLRREGYFHGMADADLEVDPDLVVMGLHDDASATAVVARLIAQADPPTAILSGQNLLTIGAIRALQQAGRSRDVALVGFDDVEAADLVEPRVTTIAQDPDRIGRLAAERMFARLDGDTSPPRQLVVPTRLVVRGSGEIPGPGVPPTA
ncbi:LacI family transcriptional regulator [Isoptericola sp. S6320L]|uniref:LacI family DNA-binding transcriptional regulator n=1 Tax=Isoptericola sp. S6320L TaxID=2926411 RepID=UPI001FF66661|nr:LacI family DNA-binding transcriptional regulator [Isoptericola sp. S6320L]MCK0117617.1 LacI family transcriptional regulator [Isoptericola sp. S6320L]